MNNYFFRILFIITAWNVSAESLRGTVDKFDEGIPSKPVGKFLNSHPIKPLDFDDNLGTSLIKIDPQVQDFDPSPAAPPGPSPGKGSPHGPPPARPPSTFRAPPTRFPTVKSTESPSLDPSFFPTVPPPTATPTNTPSVVPTNTDSPSTAPTSNPSKILSLSTIPTGIPTGVPTGIHTGIPVGIPTGIPTMTTSNSPVLAPADDIIYHTKGKVMLGPIKVYNVFYGDYSSTTTNQQTVSLINYFASNISGSSWYNIMTSYYDYTGSYVMNDVTYGGSYYAATTSTTGKISESTATASIKAAFKSGKFPVDENGVYFFIFRGSFTFSGFLTSWCGYHTTFTYQSKKIKFAVVGDPGTAKSGGSSCEGITTMTVNGNIGADSMASVYAHELVEAVSNPLGDAWYFSNGNENADECAWKFGTKIYGMSNANIMIGSKYWYIQENWLPQHGCTMSK